MLGDLAMVSGVVGRRWAWVVEWVSGWVVGGGL